MSAFMVGKAHIDAMIEAGLSRHQYGPLRWRTREVRDDEDWTPALQDQITGELTHETADRVGNILMRANRDSVNYRYRASDDTAPYTFGCWPNFQVNPVVILKAIACYRYQSCEYPGWETSEAHAICAALEQRMISHLPGYEDGPGWEITDRSQYMQHAKPRTYSQDEIDSFMACHPAD